MKWERRARLQMLYLVKQLWCAGLCIRPPYITLFLGENVLPVPTFETIFLEHNSLVHWRPHVLIFLECWIFFPQQIYFANGFWPWLASGQEHSLYWGEGGGQSARITAEVGGGKQGAAPRTPGGHPEKRRSHIHLLGPLFSSSSCFLSAGILNPRVLAGPRQLPRAGHCSAGGPVVPSV